MSEAVARRNWTGTGRGGRLSRAEYEEVVRAAGEVGSRARLVRLREGGPSREVIQALVVTAEEIRDNPSFRALRASEGAYRRPSLSSAQRRKPFTNLSEVSLDLDSDMNNLSVNQKRSKKGLVKDINWHHTEKSLKEKMIEFFHKKENSSFFIFEEDSATRKFCGSVTSKDWFDFIILIFIAANCITLAMERPTIPPW